jgi:tRNA A37 threonylcarbamoyladenosine modification protein TsaB
MRVGLAAFKGLAYATQRPLYGVPTPYALLHAARHKRSLALIDARRGEVYAQGYGFKNPMCLRPQDLIDHLTHLSLTPSILIGEGALAYQTLFKTTWPDVDLPTETAFHCPRSSFLVPYVQDPSNMYTLEPIYVRQSDAEINYPNGFPSEARLFKNSTSGGVKSV